MAEEIVNKIAASSLLQLDLETFYPEQEVVEFDLKPHLFMELILKEKDFREALQQLDWSQYQGKIVAVTCTIDAVIPAWAYMLIASYLQPVAGEVVFGNKEEAIKRVMLKKIDAINQDEYQGKRVVVKGCGDLNIAAYAFMEITLKLRPVAKSIMYGEPCSTVPVFKSK